MTANFSLPFALSHRAILLFVLAADPGLLVGVPAQAQTQAASGTQIVSRAAETMGGAERLRAVERVTFEMMTQWKRTTFEPEPYRDLPSYEPHTDVRDYTIPAWRNTRQLLSAQIVNVVRDSVATTDFGTGPQPLSVAYIRERHELFTYSPDRLILALLDAPDLVAYGDTVMGHDIYQRVRATLRGRYPATVYFHTGTGLPRRLRFQAAQPEDYGLVHWGAMDVSVWYSNWKTVQGISLATQWDIDRVGVPYKRMTIRQAVINPDFNPADSFSVSAELRAEYPDGQAARPMHEVLPQVSEPSLTAEDRIELGGFGIPAGAVRIGQGSDWLLLGTGQTPFNLEQGLESFERVSDGTIPAVLFTLGGSGSGGVVGAIDRGMVVYTGVSGEPHLLRIAANAGVDVASIVVVSTELRLGETGPGIRLAPLDLPDRPGSIILFQESTGWAWAPEATSILGRELAWERTTELGWDVVKLGHARSFDGEESDRPGR